MGAWLPQPRTAKRRVSRWATVRHIPRHGHEVRVRRHVVPFTSSAEGRPVKRQVRGDTYDCFVLARLPVGFGGKSRGVLCLEVAGDSSVKGDSRSMDAARLPLVLVARLPFGSSFTEGRPATLSLRFCTRERGAGMVGRTLLSS